MDRWSLLEHSVSNSLCSEVHYDLLIENGSDCLTWKIYEIPKLNGSLVEIKNQPNHRLVWLTTNSKKLSKERGYVRRIDFGKYLILENNLTESNFSLQLNGKLIVGIFRKQENLCQLCENI
tara:strand:+ start:160 stop:522 length:363 start_codon:yes stop_codon:yes gene_type:complete